MVTELPILACTLDAGGMREQASRYAAIRVTALERTDSKLVASIDESVDRKLVDETVEIERGCCSFFDIGWDGKQLSFAVSHAEHASALDVIEEALRS